MLIAIAGVARSGKNVFCSWAREYFQEKGKTTAEFALADELKYDLEDFVREKLGVDIWTDDTEVKNKIRDLMVAYGRIQREATGGMYWVDKLRPKIEKCKDDVIFITDCRYPNDEVDFVHGLGGKVIHISRYSVDWLAGFKIFQEGINSEEIKNDPLVKQKADLRFEWEDLKSNDDLGRKLVWGFLQKHKL
jgi:hypothetical protein